MNRIILGAAALVGLLAVSKNASGSSIAFADDDSDSGDSPEDGGDPFNRWDGLYKKWGAYYSVPWRWMKAIDIQESQQGQAKSVAEGIAHPDDVEGSTSSDGKSWGIGQETLATASALEHHPVTPQDLNDPETSIRIQAELLAQLISTFGIDDRESVVRAYNGGPHFGAATDPYYAAFVKNIAKVLAANPGDEMETS